MELARRADPADLTRQICNGWKSDRAVADIVLKPEIGRICATLGGWPGARIGQDNVIWKPPGAKPLGYHQDDSYCGWVVPSGFITVWMALDDTSAKGGTLEYVRGSHRWGNFPPIRQFHAPENYREALEEAAASVGQKVDIACVEVPAGGCAVHSGRTWHGSDSNRTGQPRRSLVTHCLSSECRFHPTEVSHIYSRYKRISDDTMDESFFQSCGRVRGIGRSCRRPAEPHRRARPAGFTATARRPNRPPSADVWRSANDR